jgi:hypothetical protein
MYYLVSTDHISPEMTVKDPMQWLRLMMEWQWTGWECEECEEDKGDECEDEYNDTNW